MEGTSEYAKEQSLRKDFWTFTRAVLRRWHLWLGSIAGLGFLALANMEGYSIPTWAVPWFAAIGLVIAAFHAWRIERRAKEKAVNDLQEFQTSKYPTNNSVITVSKELSLELVDATVIDMTLGVRVFRIKVTNLNPSQTARETEVCLDKISCIDWNVDANTPYEIRSLKVPHNLSLTPAKYTEKDPHVFQCDINPNCSKLFDLIYTRVEGGVKTMAGLAPFTSNSIKLLGDYPPLVRWRSTNREIEAGSPFSKQSPIQLHISASAKNVAKIEFAALLSFPIRKKDKDRPTITYF